MTDMRSYLLRVLRFGLAGGLNGLVSLSIIYVLDIRLQLAPELANAAGYAAGLLLSFMVSRAFVFRSREAIGRTAPRYALVVAGAFLLNQAILRLALVALGAGAIQHMVAQLCGMCAYTASSFAGCQFWVFRGADARS